jgi:hypothetical protein
MGAPKLSDAGKVIIKKAPAGSNKFVYLARQSYKSGVTPPQLKANTEKMKQVAPACAQQVRGMPSGPEKIAAFRACVGERM